MEQIYDIAVIGGGPAGYVAAIKGAQLGGKVILFEQDTVGGTCLNRGCIPTKAYIKTAEYMQNIRHAAQRGIRCDTAVSVDMKQVFSYKASVVKKLTTGVAGLLRSRGVQVIRASAQLNSETEIACDGKLYSARNIILCGGSRAGRLPFPGSDHPNVITSDGALELTELPEKLVVIGGGVIGCELATAFANFGSRVSIVELCDNILPVLDADISAGVRQSLEALGVSIYTGRKVEGVVERDGKTVVLASGEALEADKVLLSIGRVADLSCLGKMADKIEQSRGRVVVDDHMRTSIPNIYAPGDMNGRSMLAHAAFHMGEVAAACCMGQERTAELSRVPSCVYTLPEAASVGLTEEQARAKGEVTVGRFPFAANGRALSAGEPEGFVKVIADAKYGELLGVHIFGGAATEMIAEACAVMALEGTVHEAADIMHAHPTCSEAFMEACADALGRCIHLPKKA